MRLHVLLFGLLLATPTFAQLQVGTELVCAAGTYSTAANNRGVFVVDRDANTQTRMAIQGINWAFTAPVRTFIEDPRNFLLAVRQGTGHVYRVTWTGKLWQASLLSSAGVGPVIWEVARVGAWIYTTTSSGGSTANNGTIWRMPANGGTPAVWVVLGPKYQGMPTALTVVGSVLHVFLWDSPSATRPKHLSIDTAKPPVIVVRGTWPTGKARVCVILPVLPMQATYDAHTKLIVIGGRLGDVLWRTPSGATVRHNVVATLGCNPPRTQWGQSLGFNGDTGAILYGAAAGNIDAQLCHGGSWSRNVTPIGVAPNTPINGIECVLSGSIYREGIAGCAQSNGRIPCSYATSPPVPGNPRFGMGVETSSKLGLLILSDKSVSWKLGPLAPGCTLGVSPVIFMTAQVTPTGLLVRVPLPRSLAKGKAIYTQWVLVDNVNKLGLVLSGVRHLVP